MKFCTLCFKWLCFSVMLGSCQCGSKEPTPTLYLPFIFYHNSGGQDLLDPSVTGAYRLDSIKLNGNSASVAGVSITNTKGFSDPNMPTGYALNFALGPSTTKAVITIGKKISDTLYYTFAEAKMTECRYNKMIVKPPGGTTAFPLQFPVSIAK